MSRDSTLPDRQVAAALAVVCGAVMAFAARVRMTHGWLGGDEPHYLIFNVALQKYRSLDVMSVYLNRDYWSFNPAMLQPHLADGPEGPLPLHGFGGPLLWHVPYLLWGRGGAVAFIVAVSALIVVNVYYFLREQGIVKVYAGLVAALFAIGSPIYIYSSMLFVEPIAALAVLYAVRALCRKDLAGWRLALAATGLGIIPWVHGRFSIFTVTIGGMLAWRVWRDRTSTGGWWPRMALLAPLAIGLGGLEVYNVVVWHSLNPAPGNAGIGDGVFQISPFTGFAGLTLDRRFGLLWNFPLFLLVLPGILLAARRRLIPINAAIAVAVLPYVLAISTFSAWWAGYSPPARLLVAVVPLLSYYVALTLQSVHHWLLTGLAVLAGLFAFAMGIIGDVVWSLRFHPPSRANHLMVEAGKLIGLQFQQRLPNAFGGSTRSFLSWTLLLLCVAVILWGIGRRRAGTSDNDCAGSAP